MKAGDFVKELRDLEKDYNKISLRVNSFGGSVYDGLAIYNALKNSSAEIESYIDGIAASITSAGAHFIRRGGFTRKANEEMALYKNSFAAIKQGNTIIFLTVVSLIISIFTLIVAIKSCK